MTQHILFPVHKNTFKAGAGQYQLSHGYGEYRLVMVTDGKPQAKAQLKTKNINSVWQYLAESERITKEKAKVSYENAKNSV